MSHAPDSLASAEIEALKRIPDRHIIDALTDISEDYRMVVYYADVEGFAYKEIVKILDLPIGTVMSRVHRGRKALHKKLKDVAAEHGIGVKKKTRRRHRREAQSVTTLSRMQAPLGATLFVQPSALLCVAIRCACRFPGAICMTVRSPRTSLRLWSVLRLRVHNQSITGCTSSAAEASGCSGARGRGVGKYVIAH